MSTLAVLLVWFVFGVVGYAIGEQRGRPGQGAVLGIFLGPVGWLVVWLGKNYGQEKNPTANPVAQKQRLIGFRVSKDGEDLGFMDIASIKLKIKTGAVTSLDYFYDTKAQDWRPLGSCRELLSCWANAPKPH